MSNVTAPERALHLPELLSQILDFLQKDHPSLRSALRVNSLFHSQSIKILWREPPPHGLLHIPPARRQIYANHIQTLSFDGDSESIHSEYTLLTFPQLQHISIDTNRPSDTTPWIKQYLQPNLQTFEFYGGNVHEDLRHLLSAHCPRLKTLLLDNIGIDIPAENLPEFLNSFPQLIDINLSYHADYTPHFPEEIFHHLATNPKLQSLGSWTPIPLSAIHLVASEKTIPEPFPNLKTLKIHLQASALSSLIPLLPKTLRHLNLTIDPDVPLNLLATISPLQNLSSLKISHHPQPSLPPLKENPEILKKFPHLRELRLTDEEIPSLFTNLSPENLNDIWKSLPGLEKVELAQKLENNTPLLKSLGRNCPNLTEILLGGKCHFQELQHHHEKPLFPVLKTLGMDEIIWSTDEPMGEERGGFEEDAQRAVEELHRLAPILEEFYVLDHRDDDAFTLEVLRIWEDSLQSKK